jgi:hypothetical protein|tara:strand:- start:2738 stop:3529 length:792 start_codon:yes stop_codon:yes gene_type:complete
MDSKHLEQSDSSESEVKLLDKEEVKEEEVKEEAIVLKNDGCCSNLQEKMGDQDFQQKLNMCIAFSLELYRVLMGSFLTLFVPQSCDGELCGLTEKFHSTTLYDAGFSVNAITFVITILMYYFEIKRENMMINYLHVNDDIPTDNDEVAKVLVKLPENKKNKILKLDKLYQQTGYASIICFLANSILSGIIVYNNALDDKTTTVFITNVLFMAGKLSDVLAITKTDINIFYSAYLKQRVQYNDVDPDKMIELDEKNKEKSEVEV